MKIRYTVLDTTKAGNQRAEMEDAAFPDAAASSEVDAFACAIADGATQGSHSGPWARALCEAFVEAGGASPPADFVGQLVPAAYARFAAWETQYLAGRIAQGRPLQWFEEEVIDSGAFSTLVGIHLTAPSTPGGRAAFAAVAVGDSCLFVIRDGKVDLSFPLTDSGQFAGAPLLIASRAASNGQLAGGLRHLSGVLAVGDGLILCTDALAAWTLREKERGTDPATRLVQIAGSGSRDAFDELLATLRRDKQIRNDDVTLVHLEIMG